MEVEDLKNKIKDMKSIEQKYLLNRDKLYISRWNNR